MKTLSITSDTVALELTHKEFDIINDVLIACCFTYNQLESFIDTISLEDIEPVAEGIFEIYKAVQDVA